MTTKPTTLNEYIDELDRLSAQPLPHVNPDTTSAMKYLKAALLKSYRANTAGVLRHLVDETRPAGDSAGFYFDLALSRGQEIDRLSEDLAYGKEYNRSLVEALENRCAEVEALKKERDDLARQVLEAAGILRPQEEPEVRYFKTTNARHPIYYRAAGGVLEVWHDSGCWIGSAYDSLEHLFNSRKLISVSRDEAEA